MILAAPVEDLLLALEAARLPRVADELRSYLEEGLPVKWPTIEQLLSEDEPERVFRDRNPREQVIDACSFIVEQLIEPYLMVEEAQALAAAIGNNGSRSKIDEHPHSILIADPKFADRAAAAMMTEDELRAAHSLAKLLPEARRMMLARLGEGDVPVDDPEYDPLLPDQSRVADYEDDNPQRKAEEPMRELKGRAHSDRGPDLLREPWPEIDSAQIRLELGYRAKNIYGD